MADNKLFLKNFNIQSFARISKSAPIMISFPENKKYLIAEGDQETGKTSTMEAIKALLGETMIANAINTEDDDKKGSSRFIGKDGGLYQTRMTRSTFILESIALDEDGNPILDDKGKERTREEKKPMSLLRKLIGNLGIGPMEIKKKNPKEQIEWIQSYYADGVEDFKKKENEIIAKGKVAFDSRTEKKRDLKSNTTLLEQNKYFLDRDQWLEKFATISKEVEINAEIEKIQAVSDETIRLTEQLKSDKEKSTKLETEITAIEAEIKRLTDQRLKKIDEKVIVDNSIINSEASIEKNKDVAAKYESLKVEKSDIQELKLDKVRFDAMIEIEKKKEELAKSVADLTATYQAAQKELKEYIKSFTPDIPEFEIRIPSEESTDEGLFFKGKSIDQVSESELWEMCLLIWNAFDVRIVFVENINALGTSAVERFNWFIENGGYVFATEMDRAEKNIKLSIDTKIKL